MFSIAFPNVHLMGKKEMLEMIVLQHGSLLIQDCPLKLF